MKHHLTQSFPDHVTINSLAELDTLAEMLAKSTPHPAWIYLTGDLGAGKTTFCQRFITHKGYQGKITSPTYAIMQPYRTVTGDVIHCDLYRLSEPEELFEIGLLETIAEQSAIGLIEWPKKGLGVIPPADIELIFSFVESKPNVRQIAIKTNVSTVYY